MQESWTTPFFLFCFEAEQMQCASLTTSLVQEIARSPIAAVAALLVLLALLLALVPTVLVPAVLVLAPARLSSGLPRIILACTKQIARAGMCLFYHCYTTPLAPKQEPSKGPTTEHKGPGSQREQGTTKSPEIQGIQP